MHGWIKDHRKEILSDVWLMPPLYHRVWQYLKYKANHEPRYTPTQKGKILVGAGEMVTSLRCIADAVKWVEWGVEKVPSAKTIKSILDWLEGEEMISKSSNRKGTHIKLLNYGLYQSSCNGESNTEETNKKRSGPTNKKYKKYKNKDHRRNTYSDDSLEMKICTYMKDKILDTYPGARIPPNMNNWCIAIDRLMRLDKRTPREIKDVLDWIYQDEFWCPAASPKSNLQ